MSDMHRTDSQYLESKVLTASQPQLHLMLLDGAIRFGRQAQTMWTAEVNFATIDAQLARVGDIVDELAHSAANGHGDISKQLEEQYAFIYRELTASRFNEDLQKLESCLSLLEFQRDTWKQACEKLESPQQAPTQKVPAPTKRAPHSQSSFSLEA